MGVLDAASGPDEEFARAGQSMEKRIAPAGVLLFVVLAACAALSQDAGQALPDAPSARIPIQIPIKDQVEDRQINQGQRLIFIQRARTPGLGVAGLESGAGRGFANPDETNLGRTISQKDSISIFNKYLYPAVGARRPAYSSSSSGSLMGRATYAASRIFVVRDEGGKGRLNTSYFLRTLTSVAAETASRPYWRRSVGQPFSDFGSTVGNDAGMNVLHEFAPNLQQVMKSHAPRFVSRIEARVGR